ncbi:MAG: tRNA (adenosine(37)-N6)-threonylcarbamoyltransferase complex transferase subunit TsaD, partial [Actinomycetota bacterium]
HVELMVPVIAQAFVEAGLSDVAGDHRPPDVDAVAATYGPGLVGALLVGVSTAKALALSWGLPFIAVNHLEAHLYATLLEAPDLELPIVVMIVSGGHTLFVLMEDHGRYRVLGSTIDDAAGEAYDKVARYLGLGYPGGPAIDKLSVEGDREAIRFPRPMVGDGTFDVSFSGLKTAVVNHVRKHPEVSTADVAASFQEAVVDTLLAKGRAAAREVGAHALALGGGVAANSRLRERLVEVCAEDGLQAFVPSRAMCTDNAAMVASAAWYRWRQHGADGLDTGAVPNLGLG